MQGSLDSTATPVDQADFRRALGRFATGVAVILAETEGGACGITVNSFTSVSLDPPLVLWCLDRAAERAAVFLSAPTWSVSILSADQRAVSERFARVSGPASLLDLETLGIMRAPVLPGALAQLACRTFDRQVLGDHIVIVGEVLAVSAREGEGLTYFQSRYGVAAAPGG